MEANRTENALDRVRKERNQRDRLYRDQSRMHPFQWMSVLGEEYGKLCEAVNETYSANPRHPQRGGHENIIREATQVAATAVHIIECIQREEELRTRQVFL